MHERRVFISSPMDSEMAPPRAKVAAYLRDEGAIPVMWEEITPQDRRAQDAFLEGVAQSSLFLLVVGSRYGASDETGYSPTHKEANRAKELDVPRLLFERDNVGPSDRDGRLNDWLKSLHSEISGAQFSSPYDLVAKLDRRFREIAGAQENYWVKLGPLVFPGSVHQQSRHGTTEFSIRATLRDPVVRRAVSQWGATGVRGFSAVRDPRLTWGHETRPVQISSVNTRSTSTSTDEVEITCAATGDFGHSGLASIGGITVSSGGRHIGPAEQVPLWAGVALFGQPPSPAGGRSGHIEDAPGRQHRRHY